MGVFPLFFPWRKYAMNLLNDAVQNGQELAQNNASLQEGCCLLGWQLSSPCGESTLPNAKIELDGNQISSNQIKGSKIQWFPRSKLKLTTKYSNRITRVFNCFGVKYGDFTVVPTARLNELQTELESIEKDWSDEVSNIIAEYDMSLNTHVDENQEIGSLIRKYALTQGEFKSKFKLRFTKPLAMKALYEEDEQAITNDVAETLWQEIAKDASTVYKQNWFKANQPVSQVSQKVRSPFKRILSKLVDLSFIDEGIERVVDTIQEVLNNLPNNGYIKDHDLAQLTNWLLVMCHEDTLRLHAQGDVQFKIEPEIKPDIKSVSLDSNSDNTIKSTDTVPTEPTVNSTTETSSLEPAIASDDEDDERSNELSDFGFGW
jgi:hypothetical protein